MAPEKAPPAVDPVPIENPILAPMLDVTIAVFKAAARKRAPGELIKYPVASEAAEPTQNGLGWRVS